MRQGEIWSANLNPTRGSEQAGFRPIVIISGNMLNQHLPVVIGIPLTTQIKNYKGNPILKPSKINGLKKESEMLVFYIRSISRERLVKKIGLVETSELERALKTLDDILRF